MRSLIADAVAGVSEAGPADLEREPPGLSVSLLAGGDLPSVPPDPGGSLYRLYRVVVGLASEAPLHEYCWSRSAGC